MRCLKLILPLMLLIVLAGCSSQTSQSSSSSAEASALQAASSAEASGEGSSASVEAASDAARPDHVAIPDAIGEIPGSYWFSLFQMGTIEYFEYEGMPIEGQEAANTKHAYVYLPYGYDPNREKPYNVLYLMHGAGGTAEDQLGTPQARARKVNVIDNLIAKGEVEPMIIVAASYYPNNERVQTNDWDAALTKAFGVELRDYLIPALENRYNTYGGDGSPETLKATRAHRAFGGFSMGGVTTWYRVCDSLDYVKYFIPVSGCLTWGTEHFNGTAAAAFAAQSIAEQGYGKNDFFVFASAGESDYALDFCAPQMEALTKLPDTFECDNSNANQNVAWFVSSGEEHDDDCYTRGLFGALPVISQMMKLSENA